MNKPQNRKKRVEWMKQKFGPVGIIGMEYSTDREVKKFFDYYYPRKKDDPDFVLTYDFPHCIRCGCEITITYSCDCKDFGPTFDESDPDYQEWLKNKESI